MQIQDESTLCEQKDHDIENNGNNNVYICSLTKAGTWAIMRKTKSWRTALRLAAVESWGERRRQRVKNPRAKKFILLVQQFSKSLPSESRHLTTSLISRPMMISQLLIFGFLSYWYSDFCVDQLWAAQFWPTVHNDRCQSSTHVCHTLYGVLIVQWIGRQDSREKSQKCQNVLRFFWGTTFHFPFLFLVQKDWCV